MDLNDAMTFLPGHDRTVLVTRRGDDSLQTSPVNSGVLDRKVVVSSRDGLAKVFTAPLPANIRIGRSTGGR